jgi:hypothetical protein
LTASLLMTSCTSDVVVPRLSEAGYHVAELGDGHWLVTSSQRPRWATAAGGIGILAFGLGAPLLALRTVRHATVRVVHDARGTRLAVNGDLATAVRRALDAAPAAEEAPPGETDDIEGLPGGVPASHTGWSDPEPALADVAHRPPPAAGGHHDSPIIAPELPAQTTVARPRGFAPPPQPAAPATDTFVLRLDDGRALPLEPGQALLVGRDPFAEAGTLVVRLPQADGVSRTHFAVGLGQRGVWVQDRASTNGTLIHRGGQMLQLEPGERLLIEVGDIIRFGTRYAEIGRLGG